MKKRTIAAAFCALFLAASIGTETNFLVTLQPHFTLPLGNETHSIKYGIGGGAKLSFQPMRFFEFGVYGDYYTLVIPVESVDSISVFDAGFTASYILPIQKRLSLNISANAGLYKAMRTSSLTGFDVGVGLSLSYKVRPSVALGLSPSFAHYAAGKTALINGVTVSPQITFNLTELFGNRAKIKMETLEILPVFPVLYSWYENNRFATVKITNQEDNEIDNIKVSFFQPQYMGHPNVCLDGGSGKKLASGESMDVDLTAFFNERMLEMTEKTDTNAIVTVEYTFLGQKKQQEFQMVVPVYGRNSMSWADDRRAAVFVSSKDPAAMLYAKNVTSVVRENMRIGVPTNIQYAIGIFDSLAGFGINYVIDPSSAYTDNVGTETPDFLQFPYQTLSYRGGDCDDLSILMCSLLEAVGIDTAFITIPGHIYMAFDSGLTKRQALEQFGSLENFIVLEEQVWVPLEITLTDEGFNKAWRIGARQWRTAERNKTAAIYKMKDSWQIYKPVSAPVAGVAFNVPEKEEIALAFEEGVNDWILREITPKVQAYKERITTVGDVDALNDLGALYGRYGLFSLAEENLALLTRRKYIPSMINTANVLYSKKNFEAARDLYKKVITRQELNGEAPGVLAYLGVARCSYELEDYDECDAAYQKVMEMDAELASYYSYLGAFESANGRAFNLADRLAYTVWQMASNVQINMDSYELAESEKDYVGLPTQITLPSVKELLGLDEPKKKKKVVIKVSAALPEKPLQVEEAEEEAEAEVEVEEAVEIEETPEEVELEELTPEEVEEPAPEIEEVAEIEEELPQVEEELPPEIAEEIEEPAPEIEPVPQVEPPAPQIAETPQESATVSSNAIEIPKPGKAQKKQIMPATPEYNEPPKASQTLADATESAFDQDAKLWGVPRLAERGYYIQIGAFKNESNYFAIYKKYCAKYPIVGVESGDFNVLLVGPFGVDKCGAVLEKFKALGFTDAFVKCIM